MKIKKGQYLIIPAMGFIFVGVMACSPATDQVSARSAAKGIPAGWSSGGLGMAGVDYDWIARFKDPQLMALVAEAMKRNPDLKATAERVRRAEAVARLSGAEKKPQLNAQVNSLQQKQRFPGFPIKLGSNNAEAYGASLDVYWEPDLWGRLRASQAAAAAESMAFAEDYRSARASLAGQLAKAWFALGEAAEQVILAEAAVGVRVKTVASVQERFAAALEGGLASQLRLAETDLASSRASLALWESERARAIRQLELLIGRFAEGNIPEPHRLPGAPSVPPARVPAGRAPAPGFIPYPGAGRPRAPRGLRGSGAARCTAPPRRPPSSQIRPRRRVRRPVVAPGAHEDGPEARSASTPREGCPLGRVRAC